MSMEPVRDWGASMPTGMLREPVRASDPFADPPADAAPLAGEALADKAFAGKTLADKAFADKAFEDKTLADKAFAGTSRAEQAFADCLGAEPAVAESLAESVAAASPVADEERPAGAPGPGRRKAILLQGPVGPFFGVLQSRLEAAGYETVRIVFNAGDALFRGAGRSLRYHGRPENWSGWFAGFLEHFKADLVLAFGCQRKIHRQAGLLARDRNVAFFCFEEGYLRPDYVTLEREGNNARSPLRGWSEADLAPGAPAAAPAPMPGNGFTWTALYAVKYFVALRLGAIQFPYYQHHRARSLLLDAALWTRSFVRKRVHFGSNLKKIHWIIEALDRKYFVVALQVHDDLQLRHHSAGWTIETLLQSAIASFARAAHGDHHLVVKGHPLDRGHSSARQTCRELAALHGVAGRVHFVDDGSLGLLTRHCRGMVTINSTSAMVAFGHDKPVFAAGESFYESLTANGSERTSEALARFWRLTPQLRTARWKAFRAAMIAQSQINGSFYIPEEMQATARRVVERLDAALASPTHAQTEPAQTAHAQTAKPAASR